MCVLEAEHLASMLLLLCATAAAPYEVRTYNDSIDGDCSQVLKERPIV